MFAKALMLNICLLLNIKAYKDILVKQEVAKNAF